MTPNDILTVIPFHAGDAIQAERLCDWIYLLNENKQDGHCLLIADSEVHGELQTKVKLAAEIAFETVGLVVASRIDRINKPERINHLFRTAGWTVARRYRIPWLMLEPDSVPLVKDWRQTIAEAYNTQPHRYMGAFVRYIIKDQPEKIALSRIAVYPSGAVIDIEPSAKGAAPYNLEAGQALVERATKSKLFQQLSYNHETDFDKIRPDAVLLHTDKTGRLIQHLRAHANAARAQFAQVEQVVPVEVEQPKPKRGRPPKKRDVISDEQRK